MKPTIHKVKDARGRITAYRAAIGPVEREGKTPAEASEACEHATIEALRRLDNGTHAYHWHGHAYVIAPTLYGWSYWLDTLSGGMFQGSCERHEDANASALHHLAQHVWSHDVADDAAFCATLPPKIGEDIAGWIRFQRAYARHAAEGKTDAECHRLACEDSYRAA